MAASSPSQGRASSTTTAQPPPPRYPTSDNNRPPPPLYPASERHHQAGNNDTERPAPPADVADTASLYSQPESLLPAYAQASPWGRYKSEADYLAALRAWAENQKYAEPGESSFAYYGSKSMRDYENQPGPGFSRLRSRSGSKGKGEEGPDEDKKTGRRRSSISQWLTRRRTGAAVEVAIAE